MRNKIAKGIKKKVFEELQYVEGEVVRKDIYQTAKFRQIYRARKRNYMRGLITAK